MLCIDAKEGRGPHKYLNLGPQLPCYATGRVVWTWGINSGRTSSTWHMHCIWMMDY